MLGEMGTYGSMVDGTSFESARVSANVSRPIRGGYSFEPLVSRSESHHEVGASAEEHVGAQNSDMDNLEVRGKAGRNGHVWVHSRRD